MLHVQGRGGVNETNKYRSEHWRLHTQLLDTSFLRKFQGYMLLSCSHETLCIFFLNRSTDLVNVYILWRCLGLNWKMLSLCLIFHVVRIFVLVKVCCTRQFPLMQTTYFLVLISLPSPSQHIISLHFIGYTSVFRRLYLPTHVIRYIYKNAFTLS